MRRVLAVDLGGSHATCAVMEATSGAARIAAEERVCFDRPSFREVLPLIEQALHRLLRTLHLAPSDCIGLAMAFPGIVDPKENRILYTNQKFTDGAGFDLPAWCRDAFGLPFRLDNDARMALQGEREAGAARGYSDVVMMTLGTGIGGAAVLNGQPLVSKRGQAGILGGHLPVRVGGRRCSCGSLGCAESEASTWALPAVCREWEGFAASTLAAEPLIDFAALFRHADAGDRVAQQVVDYTAQVWATLAVALVHAYDPEILLVGGAVMARAETVLPAIQDRVANYSWTSHLPVIVARAALGGNAALFGALQLFPSSQGAAE